MGEVEFLQGNLSSARRNFKSALRASMANKFSVEACHSKTLLSFMDGKIDNRCYNKLGLKLRFRTIPFNIP